VRTSKPAHDKQKKNPLHNRAIMKRLNPFDAKRKEAEKKLNEERHKKREAARKSSRKDKTNKKTKKERNTKYKEVSAGLIKSYKDAEDVIAKDEALDLMISSDDE